MLPVNYLRAKYIELSSVFINEVNNNEITLFMSINEAIDNTSVDNSEPGEFSRYGGKQRIDDSNRRIDESGANKIESPRSVSINARVYWNRDKFDTQSMENNVLITRNKCKIITYVENKQLLLDTDYAVIDGYKCKIIKDPAPYGMFGKQWISADFQVITGG